MKTEKQKNNRKPYDLPEMVSIEMDKDITLQLESAPPPGPNENTGVLDIQAKQDDPFRWNA